MKEPPRPGCPITLQLPKVIVSIGLEPTDEPAGTRYHLNDGSRRNVTEPNGVV
jgi:hypothetical protein